jgi:hypothetical protein
MTLTLNLPPELELRARGIPDLQDQVISFVRDLAELEQWRDGRYSGKAEKLVDAGFADGDRRRGEGLPREDAVRRFREVQERIAERVP